MKALIVIIILSAGLSSLSVIQAQNGQHSDVVQPLSYEPNDVLDDWTSWLENETLENKFVGDFMIEFDVPKSGIKNLTKRETWYWWISNNPEEIEVYLERKKLAEE